MSLIQITPESLKGQASDVRKYNQEQELYIDKIRRLVLTLHESWKGEAQDAFVAKFQSMETVYKNLSKVLEEYASVMDLAANEMQATDQDIRRMIQSI